MNFCASLHGSFLFAQSPCTLVHKGVHGNLPHWRSFRMRQGMITSLISNFSKAFAIFFLWCILSVSSGSSCASIYALTSSLVSSSRLLICTAFIHRSKSNRMIINCFLGLSYRAVWSKAAYFRSPPFKFIMPNEKIIIECNKSSFDIWDGFRPIRQVWFSLSRASGHLVSCFVTGKKVQ